MPLRTKSSWFGVVLDAPDARELAHFYADLLGWTVFNESEGWVDLAPSKDAGYNLAFATEKDYARPVWPTSAGEPQMSMHLDIEVDDLAHAVSYALGLGAEQAAYQPQESVRVMLDPAGHPFCLYVDEQEEGSERAQIGLVDGAP
jgi:catechol 2,3-dioxygenase-like lactoylglutathione lyase family enzyme